MRHSRLLAFETMFPAAGQLTEIDQIDSIAVLSQLLRPIVKAEAADDFAPLLRLDLARVN